MATSECEATQTKPSPSSALSRSSHLALEGLSTDFSIDRSASCVPITYMSNCAAGPPPPLEEGVPGSQGASDSGGSLPCMFHVPTYTRSRGGMSTSGLATAAAGGGGGTAADARPPARWKLSESCSWEVRSEAMGSRSDSADPLLACGRSVPPSGAAAGGAGGSLAAVAASTFFWKSRSVAFSCSPRLASAPYSADPSGVPDSASRIFAVVARAFLRT
mmetsp:Transcript_42494/g.117619  ORF Transcript_42494/g.117619 Transcript_42494/m.117619 type:complete len:218 (+) Transcript_42494:1146-1799(+)